MPENTASECSQCVNDLTRRRFMNSMSGLVVAGGSLPLVISSNELQAAPKADSAAEGAVKRFYDSLTAEQRKVICMPFHHKKRMEISANWQITKPRLGDDFFTDEQRTISDQILRGVTSEDGYERFQRQMSADQPGGVKRYSVAVFGTPGSGQFEWELTGRHLTLRADGDSVKNMAFGGPIVYGHGQGNPQKNLFFNQTKKANEVFQALDAKQAEQALLETAPLESDVPIQGSKGKFPGVSVGDLSSDQVELVEQTIKTMLAPYRKEDVDEVMSILKKTGGLSKLHMAFYREDDLQKDEVWDIWRVEGPAFVWHFRGAPHVHTYLNIGIKG